MTNEFDASPLLQIPVERIQELEDKWAASLARLYTILYGDQGATDDQPDDYGAALVTTSQEEFVRDPTKPKVLIGIAGPGAAGKGTIGSFLTTALGFTRVVNTTTREPRQGEQNGVDYFFVSPSEFSVKQTLGQFALHLCRPNRGFYGVAHDELTKKIDEGENGCIIEENPENLLTLLSNGSPTVQRVILYILPPHPIIETSIKHLQHRLSLETDSEKRILTPGMFESTLGDRQIAEFDKLALVREPPHPDVSVLFVTNGDLTVTKSRIAELLGINHVA